MSLHLNRFDIEIGKAQRIGPFRVTIHHHESPENPWENWDCMTPMLTYSESTQTYDSGDGIEDFFDQVPNSSRWVSRNWRKIAAILEIDEATADQGAREYVENYGGSLSDSRYDYFREALSEKAPHSRCWGTACDYFDMLEALYDLAGIPALSTQRNGYSQGDCVRILLVATPAPAKRCGWAPDYDPNPGLKTDSDLYGACAWGDVYGYSIDDAQTGGRVDPVDSSFLRAVFRAVAGFEDRAAGRFSLPLNQQTVAGESDAVFLVGGRVTRPERPRDDSEHRPAVQLERAAVDQRDAASAEVETCWLRRAHESNYASRRANMTCAVRNSGGECRRRCGRVHYGGSQRSARKVASVREHARYSLFVFGC